MIKLIWLLPVAVWICACSSAQNQDTDKQVEAVQVQPEMLQNEAKPKKSDEAKIESQTSNHVQNAPDETALRAKWTASDAKVEDAIALGQFFMAQNRYDEVIRLFYDAETRWGAKPEITAAYAEAMAKHPDLNAKPRELVVGKDLTGMKRLGGGSSLVYKFYQDKETIAAFKPFQKRFQSNYRSEIAAYRLCPAMKCGFDVPKNVPVFFDFDVFSSLYARNSANPKDEFKEIIPTKLENGKHRVDGTYKAWIAEYADYPIEFSELWQPWLNPGSSREDLKKSASELLPHIAKRHKRGEKYTQKLAPHIEDLTIYDLARQISNLIVFDFLINNWDRFSGVEELKGVNCQIAHGRFMSIDNGASFSQTPHPKPLKHLHEITRFSRMTYEAIQSFDKTAMQAYLFPDATKFEQDKFETFWKQRQTYLDYVHECIQKNGESETFFFE